MVLVLMQYKAFKAKGDTFSLSNEAVGRYGVSRETKRRVLARLQKASRVQVEQKGNRAPDVTLLGDWRKK